jgi:hypothetical protein
MNARRLALAAPLLLAAALPLRAAAQAADTVPMRTRPERTGFRETTRYDEVVALMREAARRAPRRIHLAEYGYTLEGRPLPLAVVGDVAGASPAEVRASGKTVVYVQGNIHAGEVEGKEALLELLRALAAGRHTEWGDSLVLLVAPIFNADGNERISLTNRPHQYGPIGGMGTRANAQGLDLNRDFMKLESPEARSLVSLMNDYDPHVVMDLHTTNGSFHAYALTYAPPLHPNTDPGIDRMLRERWLPEVTRAVKRSDGWELYHYGNVPSPEEGNEGAERGWYSYDPRPRFGVNYAGLRNRFAILSEAYSYLPFADRIAVTRRFVEETLDWARAHASEIRNATRRAQCRAVEGRILALTARLHRAERPATILMGAVDTVPHPYTGLPMWRRLDVVRPETMPEFISFEPALTEVAPREYLVPPGLGAVAERLQAHGVHFTRLAAPAQMAVQEFRIDSAVVAEQAFQGHRQRTLFGSWQAARRTLPAGTLRVPLDQDAGPMVFTLLEPRSDDGVVAWNLMDDALKDARTYPIARVVRPLPRNGAPDRC